MGKLSMETEKGLYLGIDFGTTNSVISIFHYDDNAVHTIPIDGSYVFPTVVQFEEDIENDTKLNQIFGIQAKEAAVLFPDSTVMSIKRLLGTDEVVKIEINEKIYSFTPEQIASRIIEYLKLCADEYVREELNISGEFNGCVITVPANSSDKQKKRTLGAAVLAGFNEDNVFLRLEPAAAAIAYAIGNKEQQKVLVYDFGGGTFDACVLQIKMNNDKEPEVSIMSTYGDSYLGGDDIDHIMVDMIYEEFKRETDNQIDLFDFNKDDGVSKKQKRMALVRLFQVANQAKERLSSTKSTKLVLAPFIQEPRIVNINMEITRESFLNHKRKNLLNDITDNFDKWKDKNVIDLIGQTISCVEKCLNMAEISYEDIDNIFLVGGSSSIPEVKEQIVKKFSKEPYLNKLSPALSISRGAAYYCNMIMLPTISGPKIHERTIHPLGLEISGRRFLEIVPKGIEIPIEGLRVECEEPLETNYDGMTSMTIVVYEDMTSKDDNGLKFVYDDGMKRLGGTMLRNIPPAMKGEEKVKVIFKVGQDNMLTVDASSISHDGIATTLSVDELY